MQNNEDRQMVRMLVRARDDFQDMRKRMDNRIGRKADGSMQDIKARYFRQDDLEFIIEMADLALEEEKAIEKKLEKILKRFPIYTEYLAGVKGVGTVAAGWIVGEYDIGRASTVSKIWQFTGLNPGMKQGKKRIEKAKYKPAMGRIIKEMGEHVIVLTDTMIRGDRSTPGFINPFNKRLRTAMVGVLADGFIRSKSSYALEHYYAQHVPEEYRTDKKAMQKRPELAGRYGRLDASEQWTSETKKGGSIDSLMWKDTKASHRDRAARRKMIKAFLQDLYGIWRGLEGLPVRTPYMEEYLGKKHGETPAIPEAHMVNTKKHQGDPPECRA